MWKIWCSMKEIEVCLLCEIWNSNDTLQGQTNCCEPHDGGNLKFAHVSGTYSSANRLGISHSRQKDTTSDTMEMRNVEISLFRPFVPHTVSFTICFHLFVLGRGLSIYTF